MPATYSLAKHANHRDPHLVWPSGRLEKQARAETPTPAAASTAGNHCKLRG